MASDCTKGESHDGRIGFAMALILAGATYWALANIGLRFGGLIHPYVSPVWPSAGFALALILVHGYRFWPAIFIGALAVNLEMGASLPVAAGIAVANTLSSVLAAYVLWRFADFQPQLARLRDIISLILVGALLCRALSATMGVGALWLGGMVADGVFWTLWLNRWVGGAVGVLVVTPLFLAFAAPIGRLRGRKWYAEAPMLLVFLAAAAAYVFMPLSSAVQRNHPLAFVPLPFIVWIAIRFEVRGASVAALLLALVSLIGTLGGNGPFGVLPRHEAVLLLAIYIGVVAATGLLVAGAAGELRRERAQRAGLEVLQKVFNLIPVGLWITDERGRVTASNPEAHRIWGIDSQLEPDQHGEAKAWRLPGHTPIGAHEHPLALALEKGETHACEAIEIEGGDGERRIIRSSAMPMRNGGSRLVGAIGVSQDVTDLIRREQQLRILSLALEHSPLSVLITNAAGRIEYVNPEFVEQTGYGAEECVGELPSLLKSGATPPETYRDLWSTISSGQVWHGELLNRAKSRNLIWEKTSIAPLKNEHGEITHYVAVREDVTERKRVEEALRANEERLRLIMDNVPVMIAQLDRSRRFCFVNRAYAEFFGLSLAELIGRHQREFIGAASFAEIDHHFTRVLLGEPERYQRRHTFSDGRVRDLEVTLLPQFGDHGEVCGCYALGADITERVRAETALRASEERLRELNAELEQRVLERTQQLGAANRELEAFSYSVSHDLRAPLRGINGFSRLLLTEHADKLDASGQDYLQRIHRASLRLGELIDDLLKLAHVTRGGVRHERVDLSRMAGDILAELCATAPERKVETVVEEGIVVEGDSRLLRVALENLLGNAWKFTSRNTLASIRFGTEARDGVTEIYVRDNGAGFDPKHTGKLFGAFQRLHTEQEFSGTGIGLATVQRVVHAHGGQIRAEAQPGAGATFYFTVGASLLANGGIREQARSHNNNDNRR